MIQPNRCLICYLGYHCDFALLRMDLCFNVKSLFYFPSCLPDSCAVNNWSASLLCILWGWSLLRVGMGWVRAHVREGCYPILALHAYSQDWFLQSARFTINYVLRPQIWLWNKEHVHLIFPCRISPTWRFAHTEADSPSASLTSLLQDNLAHIACRESSYLALSCLPITSGNRDSFFFGLSHLF